MREISPAPTHYEEPFPLVLAAYNLRYPTHKSLPLLLSTAETENYLVDANTQKIVRRIVIAIEAPGYVKRVLNAYDMTFIQKTTISFDKWE
jgi:hypothetical protein